jgi:guanylate cyclase
MKIPIVRNFLARISGIGGRLEDRDLQTQKSVLVMLSLSAIPLGIIWTIIEFSVGEPRSGIASGLIAAFILINFLVYVFKRNFFWFRISQLIIFLVFPFILHFLVGGYTSSANVIWGLATPLIALLSTRIREGTPWFIAFLSLVALSGIVEPILFPESGMSIGTVFFEFSFNIINISVIVYLMLIYFVYQKNRALALLEIEREKSESLLLNVLPEEIAIRLKSTKGTIADRYESASILFADVAEFTQLSIRMSPEEMVDLLNQIFTHFDSLVKKYDLEKIRTIGDNYMVASGIPRPRSDHAQAICRFAIEMVNYVDSLPSRNGNKICFRIGINSGPVVAGVIGQHKFQYDVWGDVVNTASRMESHSEVGRIQISDSTYELVCQEFTFEPRDSINIKGKGEMTTWFLLDRA